MRLASLPLQFSPMRLVLLLAALCFSALMLAAPARADVVARIDLSAQTMVVYVDGDPLYRWPVSTARRGYRTPTGSYRPTRMHRMWYSKKYDNAPMPNSIFFVGGYAVNGTPHVRALGRPASHGCIRLRNDDIIALFERLRGRDAWCWIA